MNHKIAERLLVLNKQFYQSFATDFSITRTRLQPGVRRVINKLPYELNLLDVGCGNGEIIRALLEGGYTGRYVGIDSSPELLSFASNIVEKFSFATDLHIELIEADITTDLSNLIPEPIFDQIIAFATLHHIPGVQNRNVCIQSIYNMLSSVGVFFHSEWQFLNSDRLRLRVQPWESIDIGSDEVDINDYLLDWRRGGMGLRYVHHFDEDELLILAENNGFCIIETFYSDGENGRLGLYQLWQKKIV